MRRYARKEDLETARFAKALWKPATVRSVDDLGESKLLRIMVPGRTAPCYFRVDSIWVLPCV